MSTCKSPKEGPSCNPSLEFIIQQIYFILEGSSKTLIYFKNGMVVIFRNNLNGL
jgi:hypothetical protein